MSNPANQLPPEYDDIQPNDYDPQFTADISTKMRVPEQIAALNGTEDENHVSLKDRLLYDDMRRSASMNVPDKILVAGSNEHFMGRELPNLHLDFGSIDHRAADAYVGLSTPPRVLTMDKQFPHIEDPDEESDSEGTPKHPYVNPHHTHNGYVTPVRVPNESLEVDALRATPGDPLLIADEDEDELTVMRKRLDKLALHVYRLEEENTKRSQLEWVFYPLVMVYFIFKMGQWLTAK